MRRKERERILGVEETKREERLGEDLRREERGRDA